MRERGEGEERKGQVDREMWREGGRRGGGKERRGREGGGGGERETEREEGGRDIEQA